jgi:hypothetical protein
MNTVQKTIHLPLNHVRECVNLRPRAQELGKQPTVLFPGVAEGQKHSVVVPSDQCAGHRERRAIALETTLFFKHVNGVLDIVEDDD